MTVFLREATNAKNLLDLLPILTPENRRRVALCTDDRQPADLLDRGGIDDMLRMLMKEGVPPVEAIRMATLNPSEHFHLSDRGAVAPGRRADLVVLGKLEPLAIEEVFVGGVCAARAGEEVSWELPAPPAPPPPSMRIEWSAMNLRIPARRGRARVIQVIPNQIVTGHLQVTPTLHQDQVVADPGRDLQKIVVMDRHSGSGRIGLGLVTGIGLKTGAIAGTVAHDHHNLIALGIDDDSILTAAKRVAEMGGGLAAARGSDLLGSLPLPVGGLMSEEPIQEVRKGLDEVLVAARALGSPLHDPFMAMSFLGLEVIPALKITDQGLVDVDRFERVGLWV
jgi:adenine deaminase